MRGDPADRVFLAGERSKLSKGRTIIRAHKAWHRVRAGKEGEDGSRERGGPPLVRIHPHLQPHRLTPRE